MLKSYEEYINEITEDDLFQGLLSQGLFPEKIPPFLTSVSFYTWCVSKDENTFKESKKYPPKDYIRYESMRNINIPRPLAIPHPIAYRNLCKVLKDNWKFIQKYFKGKTNDHQHKISQTHLRKLATKNRLFEMNYKHFENDGEPEHDLLIGATIMVKADISNFFPSIYTHSIPWAFIGKEKAKKDRGDTKPHNAIDKAVRNIRYGETHGILIGPDASSLISEIILTQVDFELYRKGYKYIRNIDDYTCYTKDHNQADKFLLDLSSELKKYELTLNHKKTEKLELPIASVKSWSIKMNNFYLFNRGDTNKESRVTLKAIKSYLDFAIELMQESDYDAAILKYLIKVVSGKKLDGKIKKYYLKRLHHLVLLYPYLITSMEPYVFAKFNVPKEEIQSISNNVFIAGCEKSSCESIAYSLFFALKYNFQLNKVENLYEIASERNDCILLLLAYLYDKSKGKCTSKYIELAKDKATTEFDRFWVFIYEVSKENTSINLNNAFKEMRESKVSFIKELDCW